MCLSMYPSIYVFMHLILGVSTDLFIYASVLSVYAWIYLFMRLFIDAFMDLVQPPWIANPTPWLLNSKCHQQKQFYNHNLNPALEVTMSFEN